MVTVPAMEYESARESFHDFCLWEYEPLTSYEHKIKSSSLLFHSFETAVADPQVYDLVHNIRGNIGRSRTVWGVKKIGRKIQWEFYFYDYRRLRRQVSIHRLLKAIRPFVDCPIEENERLPYFMFSIDISDDLLSGARRLEEIHVYIGNPGSTVSSGICYALTHNAMKLENFYFFFDAKKQMKEILSKAACSAHIDSGMNLDYIVWPEMRDCRIIVIANKQMNDAVYFSGIDVDQLILFLRRMRYPAHSISFIEEHRDRLDHLRYDAGFDYRAVGNELSILKSGYYGTF